jgi:hypothetical protein
LRLVLKNHSMRLYSLFIFALLVFSSCRKEKEEFLVPNNTAPPDNTIPTILKENYVNKTYISILGRKPDNTEYQAGLSIINQYNLSVEWREKLLDQILAKPGYYQRMYEIANVDLLNGLDTAEITNMIYVFDFLLTDSTYMYLWPDIIKEKDRLVILKATVPALQNGTINQAGMHRRMIDNYFYDQINMGTENFVVSTFQHFLLRYPTDAELAQGKLIVDGLEGVLFMKIGKSKKEYMDIFFDSDSYYEGQVRDLYKRYLFREPSSKEMEELAKSYKTSGSYKQLQKDILKTDEYVGIE